MYSMNRSIYLNVVTIILMEKCLTIQIIYRKDTKKYEYNFSYLMKLFCARVEEVVRLKQEIQE